MILIDLPMPKACDVCPFNYDFCWCKAFDDDEAWEKVKDDWNLNVCEMEERPEYCPLKELVRCKDCKHWSAATICGHRVCEKHSRPQIFATMGHWFCADGERMK